MYNGSTIMWSRRLLAGLTAALLLGPAAHVSAQRKFLLTIDNIMRGPELYGYEPSGIRWAGDNRRIYFQWKQASDASQKPRDTYVVNRDGGYPRKLSEEETKAAPPEFGSAARDRKRTDYALDGDIFLYDFTTDLSRQLTRTAEAESNPRFTRDDKRVVF